MESPNSRPERRLPDRAIGIAAARAVRAEVGYAHPTELDIETLAFMRGALVRVSPTTGARANLVRVGGRGVIGVAAGLTVEERRWAIAHELGHFEAHATVSFLGLCTGDDMVSTYEASGREQEANAFAAELLMPEDLFVPRSDVASVSWGPMRALAEQFRVSATASALRFLDFTDERVALVCAKDGVVTWAYASKDFGRRPARGSRVAEWTEARAFFDKGEASSVPELVSASAWIDGARDEEELVEHVDGISALGVAMSLLWWRP
jgi:hypothetical protein